AKVRNASWPRTSSYALLSAATAGRASATIHDIAIAQRRARVTFFEPTARRETVARDKIPRHLTLVLSHLFLARMHATSAKVGRIKFSAAACQRSCDGDRPARPIAVKSVLGGLVGAHRVHCEPTWSCHASCAVAHARPAARVRRRARLCHPTLRGRVRREGVGSAARRPAACDALERPGRGAAQ